MGSTRYETPAPRGNDRGKNGLVGGEELKDLSSGGKLLAASIVFPEKVETNVERSSIRAEKRLDEGTVDRDEHMLQVLRNIPLNM